MNILTSAKRIVIVGYGIDGKSVESYLRKKTKAEIEIKEKISKPSDLDIYRGTDCLFIRSPGVSPSFFSARQYTTSTNIFFSEKMGRVIGVTGTKGKSTTASLIYSLLKEQYEDVRLGGNIGTSVLDLIEGSNEKTIWVVELSSYQLADCHFSPEVALITNWYHEHTDFHGSDDSYKHAKQNIFRYQKKGDIIVYDPSEQEVVNWLTKEKRVGTPYTMDFPFDETKNPLRGLHNKKNIQGALTVARLFGVSDVVVSKALYQFKPLPHRLEFVGSFKGISFFDDAIATTPESTIYALKSIPQVQTIFLGGTDRGYDFSSLVNELVKQQIDNIVLFPDTGKRIRDTLKNKKTQYHPRLFECNNMRDAVDFAYAYTKPGGACLLSTASPSYSLWRNFHEKGNQFQQFVISLGV